MGDREIIAAGLKPMFARAEKDGLWFFSGYQQLWFSPSELKAEQSQGNFMWGAVNWQLRNPQERLQQLEHEIKDKQNEIVQFKKRLAQSVPVLPSPTCESCKRPASKLSGDDVWLCAKCFLELSKAAQKATTKTAGQ